MVLRDVVLVNSAAGKPIGVVKEATGVVKEARGLVKEARGVGEARGDVEAEGGRVLDAASSNGVGAPEQRGKGLNITETYPQNIFKLISYYRFSSFWNSEFLLSIRGIYSGACKPKFVSIGQNLDINKIA